MGVDSFLRRFPPFDGLDDEALRQVADGAREERFPDGSVILRQGGDPADSLYVILRGSVEVVADGRVLDAMGEGDVFGHMSLVTGEEPVATIRTTEDTACFTFEREVATEILGTRAGAEFITETLRRRFDDLAKAARTEPIRTADMTVGSLVHRTPLVCDPSASVAEVARAMADAHSSAAVFTTADDHLGIVTDVDLRVRVLADGLEPTTAVRQIATVPAATVAEGVLAAEALFRMVQGGFHHLPVVSVSGALVGVVTETDVIGFGSDSPFAIRTAIEGAADVEGAVAAARRLPGAVAALVEADMNAVHIGHIVGATIDVLTRRLLDLAFDRHGPAPVAWAWLAFGSLGRHEQALHTDQDHGLAYEGTRDDEERLDPYFSEIAEFVTRGLEDAGIPRCKGNMMAVSDGLRRSVEGWVDQLGTWIDKHESHAAEIVAVVFDFRQVAGPLDIEPVLNRVVRTAATHGGFMRRLAARALAHEPPAGRFRDFIVEGSGRRAGTLDLKHGGIVPITDIARFHALAGGVSAHRTLDRLRLAAAVRRIDPTTQAGLEEAFTLLWQLRLEHQVACVRAGEPPDDFIRPNTLTPVRRQGLREAFRVITRAQRALSADRAGSRFVSGSADR
jgi:CBS domain-containing protein